MGENDGRDSNQPKHDVYLEAFCIQRNEVSRTQYGEFVQATGYQADGWEAFTLQEADLPVTGVLWEDAQAYCAWAGMRLPSEAEWEKAARGTDGRRFPWGNAWDREKANTQEYGAAGSLKVGSFPDGASPYGVLDMSGNAAEWVNDFYEAGYYLLAPARNPLGPAQILDHVLRGGSYASTYDQASCYFRDSSHSVLPNHRVGFRCAVNPSR